MLYNLPTYTTQKLDSRSTFTLLTPFMAAHSESQSVQMVVACRRVLGLMEGMMWPSIFTYMAKRLELKPHQRSPAMATIGILNDVQRV